MNIKDVVKIIQSSECAQIATFGKDETEGFPEIRGPAQGRRVRP